MSRGFAFVAAELLPRGGSTLMDRLLEGLAQSTGMVCVSIDDMLNRLGIPRHKAPAATATAPPIPARNGPSTPPMRPTPSDQPSPVPRNAVG